MCGITGIYAFNEIGRVNMINLASATQALSLRGPDNQGIFNDHFVGMGHRRLSIIDVSSSANQPMYDDSDRYVMVYNGEIYNYRKLRDELVSMGISFRTESDTEVLLKLYIHFGEKCLEKLNGFFAFAIYDRTSGKMFIARDRMGIKPLLYYQDEDKILFASEMKSILAYGIDRKLNLNTLYEYLQLNYIPSDHSMIAGVKKLLPGHFMHIENGRCSIQSYFDHPEILNGNQNLKISYDKALIELKTLLDQSVADRLVSDVPLGAFLSGGIDSSVITALASRHTDNLNTFSIGYRDEPYFDETNYASLVARKFQTNHTVFKLSNNDLYGHLHSVLDYIDEPFADSSALAVYVLSHETRKKVTVALSGDGADEIFSGYNKHSAFLRTLKGGFSSSLVSSLHPLWSVLPKSRNNPLGNKFRQLERFSKGMQMNLKDRYWAWAGYANEDEARNLLSEGLRNKVDEELYVKFKQELLHALNRPNMNSILFMDSQLVLPNDMLTKVDLMSMANSLEVHAIILA
jgi:asparagine synthase (glutamine-hydrolysing)